VSNIEIYERILANKMMKQIKGKLAFTAGKVTTNLISGIRKLIQKN
jgi:hypothetical protein